LTPAYQAAAAAQIGRPLTSTGPLTINLRAPGSLYSDRIRQLDFTVKKILPIAGNRLTVGLDIANVMNNNVTLAFNPTFVTNTPGWNAPASYMNPRVFRLNAEYSF
jgi:hypothetical protein